VPDLLARGAQPVPLVIGPQQHLRHRDAHISSAPVTSARLPGPDRAAGRR
jgi:hypothetical protein